MHEPGALTPGFSPVRGRSLLIALSGGADSVALALLLSQARSEYGLTLHALSVDHGIRPDSGDDVAFCRELCAGLDIPFYSVRLNVPDEAKQNGVGLETIARDLRYRELERFRRYTGSDYIALAHHMDDQAETVLMHLGRGAGLEGACGMRVLVEEQRLYRPLLGYRKSELVGFLRRQRQIWREDVTNRVADNPRNRLRLNVMPELEKCYPQFTRALSRFAQTAQLENELMEQLTYEWLSEYGKQTSVLSWLSLENMPHRAILRRAIRRICPEALSFEDVTALEALCFLPKGRLDYSKDHFAERTGHRLYFVPKAPPSISVPLDPEGETDITPLGRITVTPWSGGPIRDDPLRQALDRAALKGAVVRTRRPGDRIRPLGGGDKLLSDYFIDKKVDRPLRDATPLVAVGERIHWVCGIGISQEAALKDGCQAVCLEYIHE